MTFKGPAPSPEEIERFFSALRDPKPIYDELTKRGIVFTVLEGGQVVAGQDLSWLYECDCDGDDPSDRAITSYFHFEEAAARLNRGEALEALIHIERAIPALDGLHDAVRKLQR
ncbi:hypothetical protein [Labrys sp. 22185]|uniref:hypothetical protein n=1 Tax=Labrys sp. 22185 TaxID=3453888 RepID=UPI003F85751D